MSEAVRVKEWREEFVDGGNVVQNLPKKLQELESEGYSIFQLLACGEWNYDTRILAWRWVEVVDCG